MDMWIDPLFTADDLEANRKGILSAAQKTKLRSRQPMVLMLALLVASLPLIVVIAGILIFTNQSETRDPFYEASLVLVLICTFIAGGVLPAPLAFMWPLLRRSFRALTEKTVLFVDGEVDFQPTRW